MAVWMKNHKIFAAVLPGILLLWGLGVFFSASSARAAQEGLTFSTWEGFEVDKCASIWLIKRFIDPDAEILFYPRSKEIDRGIPFDTPDAKFRRYFNMSTYESLMRHYRIKDGKLKYIGKIIHDIEVNTWEKKVMPETSAVQDAVNRIIWAAKDNEDAIRESGHYFDSLYGNPVLEKL